MSVARDPLARALLDALEQEEMKLLAWGAVGGGFSGAEVDEFAAAVLGDAGSDLTPEELRTELAARRLLFSLRDGHDETFRTRMAEGVRLFSTLRQMFPNRPWRLAPTLVADFRIARRARRYPRREIAPATAIERLQREVRMTLVRRQALEAMLRTNEDGTFRLAEFQFQATRRMLLDLEGRASRGLIICAGTGTGKTLAFYIPALTHLATLIERDGPWTKAVAVYPRNELLKDQFTETYAEARRLDPLLRRTAGRKLTLGAFFGPTPRDAADVSQREWWGPQENGGYVCPFLRCPRCEGALVWATADVASRAERLRCATAGCPQVIEPDEVVLTRNRMAESPPDLLFATTEMLNRQMGNSRYGRVFGLGPGVKRPHLMLLDEVHTYSGTTGAQVALLLRRWQHALGSRVQFTGLSATLRAAPEFFGQLVGLRPGSVEEVSPKEAELDPVPESVEHILALRGDPGAGAPLLSTSIQAAMLLRRVLDPGNASPSRGLYGRKVFLFTDDLDVTNRLYHNLLNAEGYDPNFNQPRPTEPVLAALRSTAQPDNGPRLACGQSWQLCEDIGHPYGLAQRIRVSRTSSQDEGVDQASDVVVATAALEVGYNDPDVGAVMQHKAPRDWAAFLQRKGRAGRRRQMRPWTVVVLSDYGRDRLAYQAYDQLFDPELPLRLLPVGNRYVLRMQAAFALMDWLASIAPGDLPSGNLWADLSGPVSGPARWVQDVQRRQDWCRQVLSEVLDGSDERCRSLERYLRAALGLSHDETQAVLWDPPRPLMTAVIPTLVRRLESGWRRIPANAGEPTEDYVVRDHPMPDFVPRQLFGDLNLPEVEVVIPPALRGRGPQSYFLPLVQAVQTLAPGKVTRRFGHEHGFSSHWVQPPDLQLAQQALAVEAYCTVLEEAGTFQHRTEHGVEQVRCVRPWQLSPTAPPRNVAPTSNSFLEWRSQLSPAVEDDRFRHEPPRGSGWDGILDEVRFYTHNQRSHARVRRFAVAARAGVRFRDGSELDTTVRFVEQATGAQAAVGFTQESDGIVFRFRLPADMGLGPDHPNRRKVRAFRAAYFRERVGGDPTLSVLANPFQREWLGQAYLSAAIRTAIEDGVSLEEAVRRLHAGDAGLRMAQVLDAIFQTLDLPPGQGQQRQRMHDALVGLCRTPDVPAALRGLAAVLWGPPDDGWRRSAAARYKATLGGALLEACQHSCPQLEAGDLYLDLDPGPRPPDGPQAPDGVEEVWVTESTIGGGGVVEEVFRSFVADPRRFFRVAESALAPTDYEVVDRELTRVLDLAGDDPGVRDAFEAVRGATDHATLQQATAALRSVLARRGVLVNHPVMSGVHSRVLRPGSSPDSDALLRDIVREWNREEERLGVEIDPRVIAYVAAERPDYQARLAAVGAVPAQDPGWRFQAVYGLLWPRGFLVRSQGLSFYNPFAQAPPPDREILLDLLRANEPTVAIGPGWREAVEAALAARGSVRLTAPAGRQAELKEALLTLAAEPLEVGFLHLHPNTVGVEQEPDRVSVALDLREVLP